MGTPVHHEIAALHRLTVHQLRARYAAVYGEGTAAANRAWLVKRIAYRRQVLAEGDLSERARRRAAELANDADLRLHPPRTEPAPAPPEAPTPPAPPRDERLPPPGTVLARPYRGETLQVRVLDDGFEFRGRVYPSLSAVAKAATGGHCNGFLFFRLALNGGKQ
jgi:hypothetical protein